jgi:hypothetical protein
MFMQRAFLIVSLRCCIVAYISINRPIYIMIFLLFSGLSTVIVACEVFFTLLLITCHIKLRTANFAEFL